MATFKDRIEDLAGTIPATADGEQFLKDGVIDVVVRTVTSHPTHIPLFCKEESISDSGTTVHDVHVHEVIRGGKTCREIPSTGRNAAVDSSSLFYASEDDPVYYFLNEKIYVKPTGGTVTMSLIQHGTVNSWDTGTSSVDNMPDHHYNQVIMYAGIQVLHHKMVEMNSSIIHSDQDGTYTASSSSSQGWEKVRDWLESEDMEMSASTVQALGAEMQQFVTEYQWYAAEIAALQQQYNSSFMVTGQQ